MAYVTSNPPRVLVQGAIGNGAPTIWAYSSADASATVAASQYFSNGKDLGMEVNDLVFVVDTGTPLITTNRVKTVVAAGVTVSAGTTVGAT